MTIERSTVALEERSLELLRRELGAERRRRIDLDERVIADPERAAEMQSRSTWDVTEME